MDMMTTEKMPKTFARITLNVKNGLNVWFDGERACYCDDEELTVLFVKFFCPQIETVLAFKQLMKNCDAIIAFRDGSRVVMVHGTKA